ncbi:MAG: EAL domain-containing protein [Ilumatobacter sp.]|uniref:sensor domain-containing protein n=1 Tax=Ilumatobacter sp. TaxID=1967498 RepID=UPI00391C43AC
MLPSPDDLPDPLVVLDGGGHVRFVNEIACQLMSWNAADLLGNSIFSLVHPDDMNLALASFESVGSKRTGELIVSRVRTGLGAWMSLELRGNQREIDGQTMTVLICRDISNRHALELDGGEVAVLRSVMNNMHGMIALVDPDGRVRSVNGAVTRLLGHDPELVAGQAFVSLLHDDDRAQVLDVVSNLGIHESAQLDARFRTISGDYLTCEFTVNNLSADATLGGYIVSGQVAAALSDARERVDFLADHDRRTGLLNRDGFMKGAHELLRQGGGLGLMILDVVQFRSINELYGERVGDAVLTAVAQRIDDVRWPDLLTARFGGDEFVLAVRSASVSAIEMLRERIRREAARPIVHDGQEINIEIRTATAFEARPQGLDSLLASASNELMAIKRNAAPESGGITFDAINERRVHLDQLRAALASGEIQPFFQPIVDANGTVIAVEALVRWVHPLRGVLGVGEILPIAQMAGLAKAIDDQVLDLSLAFASQLTGSGYGHVEVHVNVDPKVISEPAFASSFLSRCESHGTNPAQIVVELTETDLLAPGATALNNMQTLRRAGTHVSIDDFGTGYSSLSHLLELPVDGVKIDRRFVAGIDIDTAATNLTTAILGLSESLQLSCVAEGVEQPYQLQRLVSLGCSSFQGWLFSPAVSATEMLTLLPRLDAVPVAAH